MRLSSAAEPEQIIVIGASAGGVTALQQLVSDLPRSLNAALFVVLHTSPSAPSVLPEILQRCTALRVTEARDGEPIERSAIVVARPDYHLVLEPKRVRLTRGPKENRHRPSIDALFRSASHAHSVRVTGVVLTGALDDGTAGLWSIRDRGGIGIVQDPEDAAYPSMPSSALQGAGADHVVPLAAMGELIARLTREPRTSEHKPMTKELQVEVRIAMEGRALQQGVMHLGPTTPYTCPECHGVLVQLKEGGVPRFRCHTGHAYSINNLLAEITEYVEDSLWNAVRSIEESSMLLDHMAKHLRDTTQNEETARICERKAKDALRRADIVRKATLEHQTLSADNLLDADSTSR